MVTTIVGSTARADAHTAKYQSVFVSKYTEYDVERFEGNNIDDPSRVQSALLSRPMFSSKKLVIIKSSSQNSHLSDKLQDWIADRGEQIELLLLEPEIDKRKSYYKWLQKHTDLHDYSPKKGQELVNILVGISKDEGVELSPSDARYLIDRIGENEQLAASEIKKLSVFARIDRELIDEHTEPAPRSKIFDLLEAIASGNTERAKQLYEDQRAQKVEPQAILAMIIWQLQLFTLVTGTSKPLAEVSKASGVGEYPLQKAKAATRRLGRGGVANMIDKTLEAERLIKRDYVNPDQALKNLISSL